MSRSAGRRGFRLASAALLLAAIPLLPLVAVEAMAVRTAQSRATEAQRAGHLIERVAGAARLRAALRNESMLTVARLEGRAFKLSDAATGRLLGLDLVAAIGQSQAVVDRARAAPVLRAVTVAMGLEGLDELRTGARDGTVSSYDVQRRYTDADERIGAVIVADLAAADIRLRGAGAMRTLEGLQELRESTELLEASLRELSLLFAEMTTVKVYTEASAPRFADQRAIVRYLTRRVEARVTAGSRAADAIRALHMDDKSRRYEQAANRLASATTSPLLSLDALGEIVRCGLTLWDHQFAIVGAAASDVVETVQEHVAAERRHRNRDVALTLVVVAGVALAIAVALRWMRRPLDRLVARARAVSAGAIDLPPLRIAGPREVKQLSASVNEVCSALDQLPTILAGAARGEGASAVWGLPGPLGNAVRHATERLDAVVGELERLALTDQLTGLANRLALQRALARVHGGGGANGGADGDAGTGADRAVAMLITDLDGFKEVNDTLGHAAGDALLRAVASALTALLRPGDHIFRLGGDEFAILMEHVDGPAALEVGHRVVSALSEPFAVDGARIPISASVGVSVAATTDEPGVLVRNADLAMYAAKRAGKNRVAGFSADLYEAASGRARLRANLDEAIIAGGQLHVAYQPVHRAADGQLVGVEALMRWTHPIEGAIPPAEFIPVAEESGLIDQLGAWIVDESVAQIGRWRRESPDLVLSVNVSPRQLLDVRFPDHVAACCERHGVEPSALVLEVTETGIIIDPAKAAASLTHLRELGVRTAIDDYGSGNASIAYLRHLPIDIIKIDRSLVAGITEGERDRVLTQAVVDLAHGLGKVVTAEGVETTEQLAAVRSLGCEHVQGFLFGVPVTAEQTRLLVTASVSG